MKSYFLAAFVFAILLFATATESFAQTKTKFILINPTAGSVLRAGDQIEVSWEVKLDKAITDNPFGEAELLLQTNEGGLMRISPQLSPFMRKFNWTVPAINTTSARIVLQAGIEGEGDLNRFFQKGTFSINATGSAAAIYLNSMKEIVRAGDNLDITWTSTNTDNDAGYDVMVSYDRAAHFYKAGTSTINNFSLPVDPDFAGTITIQIVGRGADGSKVSSFLTRDATVRVGGKDNR